MPSVVSRVVVMLHFVVLAACEGRTALHISACTKAGAVEPCSNPCGDGVRTCKGGSWSTCAVPLSYLACHDTCGDGTQLCEDGQRKGACQVADVVKDCSTACGSGTMTCTNNAWQPCTAPQPKQPQQPKLTAKIRDFHITFPDMNHDGIRETGIVAATLGSDDKPVYSPSGPTSTVIGGDTFNQWFRDIPGTNTSTSIDIPLASSNAGKGVYTYNNTDFFPIDDRLFGNEGQLHNYAFTAEIATTFHYRGGETFTFSGDDDVFVFINRKLAIDLGGIHSILSATVDLDAQATELGIAQGGVYSMHIFFAERHPTGSDFVIETTISEFDACR